MVMGRGPGMFGAGTLRSLAVSLGADTMAMKRGFADARREVSGFEDHVKQSNGFLSRMMSTAVGFGTAMVAIGGVKATFGGIQEAVIGMNSTLESSTLQFETLMGDADKAKAHVEGLFEFAKRTPFETGPIIQASRMLQTFGGDALNSMDNLQLFGDAAAAVSTDFSSLSFWVGRMYSAVKGGQPFGEAAMRLQELAVLTPEVRQQMEEMAKSGADWSEVWGVFSGDLERFNGAMAKQATTWAGLTSTLSDAFNLLMAEAFRPMFAMMKEGIATAIDFFSNKDVQQAIMVFGTGVSKAIKDIVSVLGEMVRALVETAGPVAMGFGLILKVVAPLFELFVEGIKGIAALTKIMGPMAPVLIALAAAWWLLNLAMAANPLVAGVIAIVIGIGLIVKAVEALEDAVANFSMDFGDMGDTLHEIADETGESFQDVKDRVQYYMREMGMSFTEAAEAAEREFERMKDPASGMTEAWAQAWQDMDGITTEGGRLVGAGIRYWEGDVDAAAKDMADGIPGEVAAAGEAAEEIARQIPADVAQSILEGRDAVVQASILLGRAVTDSILEQARIDEIRTQMEEANEAIIQARKDGAAGEVATETAKYIQLELELAGHLARMDPASKIAAGIFAKYIKEGDPAVQTAWEATLVALEDRAFILKHNVEQIAADLGIALPDAMALTEDEVAENARLAVGAVVRETNELRFLKDDAHKFMREYVDEINVERAARGNAQITANAAKNALKFDASAAGRSSAQTFINGMLETIRARRSLQDVHLALANLKTRAFGASLPTEGPFAHPEIGAISIAQAWMGALSDTIIAHVSDLTGASSQAAAALAIATPGVPQFAMENMPEAARMQFATEPSMPMPGLGGGATAEGPGSGGDLHLHVDMPDATVRPIDKEDIVELLTQAGYTIGFGNGKR